jgi:hypothetical protein
LPWLCLSSPPWCTCFSAVRPNPSLNRTRYGKRHKPGPRHMVHHRVPGLRRLPPRARLARTLGRTSATPANSAKQRAQRNAQARWFSAALSRGATVSNSEIQRNETELERRLENLACRAGHSGRDSVSVVVRRQVRGAARSDAQDSQREGASLPASIQSSQFNEPRPARNAFRASAPPPSAPRSLVMQRAMLGLLRSRRIQAPLTGAA